MDEKIFTYFRAMSREDLIDIWEKSKVDVNSLSESQRLMAFIMEEHEEYREYWENFDKYRDYEFDPETEVNPFLHVTIHHIIETQIRRATPPQIERIFQSLKDIGKERNDAIHLMGTVLVTHLFDSMKEEKPFDELAYVRDMTEMLKEVRQQA